MWFVGPVQRPVPATTTVSRTPVVAVANPKASVGTVEPLASVLISAAFYGNPDASRQTIDVYYMRLGQCGHHITFFNYQNYANWIDLVDACISGIAAATCGIKQHFTTQLSPQPRGKLCITGANRRRVFHGAA